MTTLTLLGIFTKDLVKASGFCRGLFGLREVINLINNGFGKMVATTETPDIATNVVYRTAKKCP